MEEWSQKFWQSLAAASQDTERWWQQLNENLAEAADALIQTTDDWSEQVQQVVEPEIEQLVDDWYQLMQPWESAIADQVEEVSDQLERIIDPWVNHVIAGIDQWVEELSGPINSTLDPILQDQVACVGCRHYYGQTHGGHLLVCAMHPFGADTERCPDWQSFWPDQSDSRE